MIIYILLILFWLLVAVLYLSSSKGEIRIKPESNPDVAYIKRFRNEKGEGGLIIYKKDIERMKKRPPSKRKYGEFSMKSKEYKYCEKYGHIWDTISQYPHLNHITTGCSYCGLDCYEPKKKQKKKNDYGKMTDYLVNLMS